MKMHDRPQDPPTAHGRAMHAPRVGYRSAPSCTLPEKQSSSHNPSISRRSAPSAAHPPAHLPSHPLPRWQCTTRPGATPTRACARWTCAWTRARRGCSTCPAGWHACRKRGKRGRPHPVPFPHPVAPAYPHVTHRSPHRLPSPVHVVTGGRPPRLQRDLLLDAAHRSAAEHPAGRGARLLLLTPT